MTNDVSRIRIGIIVAFAIAAIAILADLCYVLWRRRRFRRQNLSGESDINNNNNNNNNNTTTSSNSSIPSKELLYFFCWKNQFSRVEPADGGGARPVFHSATTYHGDPQEPIDLLKLQEMHGPSRVLFTIKEEEKEEETEQQQPYFSDDQKLSIEKEKKRVCLKNWFEDSKTETEKEEEQEQESPVMVVVNIDEMALELETPFSTPCASPPYYTPIPSPSRDDHASVVVEEVQTIDRNLIHTVTIEADV